MFASRSCVFMLAGELAMYSVTLIELILTYLEDKLNTFKVIMYTRTIESVLRLFGPCSTELIITSLKNNRRPVGQN